MTLTDREEISRGLAAGSSLRKIAHQLGRAPSSVSREVRRNQGPRRYRASRADERAWHQAERPKRCRLAVHGALRFVVAEKLRADWSPAQIALLAGARNTHIATLVERRSRFVQLVHVEGKGTDHVVQALVRQVGQLPRGVMASLTWDRGMELARHKAFTVATAVAVYFCDPKSPWQRGTNENTNGLLRQYFPKGTDLSQFSQAELDGVALKLNTRPRKTLGFRTPGEQFAQSVAMIG